MELCLCEGEVGKGGHYQSVSNRHQVRSSPVYVDLLALRLTLKDIGFKSGSARNVPDRYRLVREQTGPFKQVGRNGDTTLIGYVRLGNNRAMKLREEHFSEGSIHS